MTETDRAEIEAKIAEWASQCDREFAVRLIDMFLTDAPKRLTALRQAFEQSVQDEAKRAAHTLKSSAGQVGASYYAKVALQAEVAARDGRMAEIAAALTWLENEFPALRVALQALSEYHHSHPSKVSAR